MRFFLVLACLTPGVLGLKSAGGQSLRGGYADVEGRVVESVTGAALEDVHVFIAGSMVGSVTTADGRFHLRRIPVGAHTLYVSRLGYAPVRIDTLFRADREYRFQIQLNETVLAGPELTVTAERDPSWYKRLDKFTRIFIGESPNARECAIENPEVLSFETRWWGKLTAEAREPLVISNRALGYRVTYYLEEFEAQGGTIRWDGEPFFEELAPSDSAEAARWRRAREAAYRGSLRHFMISVLRESYRDEGFVAHRRPSLDGSVYTAPRFGFDRNHLMEFDADASEQVLDFHGYVEVVYTLEPVDDAFLRSPYGAGSRERVQRSYFELTDGPARLDEHGEVVEPYGLTVYGYFAYERIADLVPKDYEP